jgi:hypothetical protein
MKISNAFLRMFLIVMGTLLITACTNNYKKGMKCFEEGKYEEAKTYFFMVTSNQKDYAAAQIKKNESDSLLGVIAIERQAKEFTELKEQIKREIKSIDEFDGSKYRADVPSLQLEVGLFSAWNKIIRQAEALALVYDDNEANTLARTLKTKVGALQKAEFPKIRKRYGDILNKKLWEDDIEVKAKGSGYTTLEFVGGAFAANKNKQEMQNAVREVVTFFRFDRVNYKWYQGDDEYTYYTLSTSPDETLVNLQ